MTVRRRIADAMAHGQPMTVRQIGEALGYCPSLNAEILKLLSAGAIDRRQSSESVFVYWLVDASKIPMPERVYQLDDPMWLALRQTVGAWIDAGIGTRNGIAALTGYSYSYVRSVLNGGKRPSTMVADAIMGALGRIEQRYITNQRPA